MSCFTKYGFLWWCDRYNYYYCARALFVDYNFVLVAGTKSGSQIYGARILLYSTTLLACIAHICAGIADDR